MRISSKWFGSRLICKGFWKCGLCRKCFLNPCLIWHPASGWSLDATHNTKHLPHSQLPHGPHPTHATNTPNTAPISYWDDPHSYHKSSTQGAPSRHNQLLYDKCNFSPKLGQFPLAFTLFLFSLLFQPIEIIVQCQILFALENEFDQIIKIASWHQLFKIIDVCHKVTIKIGGHWNVNFRDIFI